MSIANHSVAIALSFAFLLPFAFITLTALMTPQQALSLNVWPHPFVWTNFWRALVQCLSLFRIGATLGRGDFADLQALVPYVGRRFDLEVPCAWARVSSLVTTL